MDSTRGVTRIISVCMVGPTLSDAGLYEIEKAPGKVHHSHPARGAVIPNRGLGL